MMVFFRNIPSNTSLRELKGFISPVIKGGLFTAKGEMKKVEILVMRDKILNSIEHHAVATIEPDTVALRVIKKLHGKPLKGKHIAVRQYFIRSARNDNRVMSNDTDLDFNDRRTLATRRRDLEVIEDRRRDLEIIEDIGPKFTGLDAFHRRL